MFNLAKTVFSLLWQKYQKYRWYHFCRCAFCPTKQSPSTIMFLSSVARTKRQIKILLSCVKASILAKKIKSAYQWKVDVMLSCYRCSICPCMSTAPHYLSCILTGTAFIAIGCGSSNPAECCFFLFSLYPELSVLNSGLLRKRINTDFLLKVCLGL